MRARTTVARFLAAAAVLFPLAAAADGRCNLNEVVGYQILFGKPIQAYIQGGTKKNGYRGCEADRVLVFTDNTGVRCKGVVIQSIDGLPNGYLFANAKGELKLCVEGELFDVQTTN